MGPQGNPGSPGMPQNNPYQNGQGPENPLNNRKEAWDAQYRQNHWSSKQGVPQNNFGPFQGNPGGPQGGQVPQPQENPYQNGVLGRMPVPTAEEVPSDAVIVDNEQDAEIVLEAARKAIRQEDKGRENAAPEEDPSQREPEDAWKSEEESKEVPEGISTDTEAEDREE